MATRKKTQEELTELDAPQIDADDTEDTEMKVPEVQATEIPQGREAPMQTTIEALMKQMAAMQEQMAKQADMMQRMASGEKITPPKPMSQARLEKIRLMEIAKKAAQDGKDAFDIMVDLFVPHRDRGEDKFYWFKINNRSAQIPANDTRQTMRLPFALALTDHLLAKQREEDYIDNVPMHDPLTNPHEGKP